MTDLDRRFGQLDTVDAPDLWGDIRAAERRPAPEPLASRHRVLAAGIALLLAAAGVALTARAFFTASEREPVAEQSPSGPTRVVSADASDAAFRCTATFPPSAAPGERYLVDVTYAATGRLAAPVFMHPWLEVRDANGELLYSTQFGPITDESVVAGTSNQLLEGEPNRWRLGFKPLWGPRLLVSAHCGYITRDEEVPPERAVELASVSVDVAASGPAPPGETALQLALFETDGLFDECRPVLPGEDVVGRIEPPAEYEGDPLEPFEARCGARLREYPGFTVVDLLFASPPDLSLPNSIEEDESRGLRLPRGRRPAMMGRWTFVATARGVRDVVPAMTEELWWRGPRGGKVGALWRPPEACGDRPCEGIRFVHHAGAWKPYEEPFAGFAPGETSAAQLHHGGIVFFRPSSTAVITTLGEPVILGRFSSLGRRFGLAVVETNQGLQVRLFRGDNARDLAASFLIEQAGVPACRATLAGGVGVTEYPEGYHLDSVGLASQDVAAVEVHLEDGQVVRPRLLEVPGARSVKAFAVLARLMKFERAPSPPIRRVVALDSGGNQLPLGPGRCWDA